MARERTWDQANEVALSSGLSTREPPDHVARCERVAWHRLPSILEWAASLKLHLQEVTSKDPTYKMPPGRLRTYTTLTATEADAIPQDGLAGELLAIVRSLPDGTLGQFQANGRMIDLVGLPDGAIAYPFVRNLVRTELLDAGYYTRSQRFRVQPDCARIATLAQASAATVHWWEQQQTAEPRLCAALVAVCTRASIPLTGGGG